ncbi:MAG: SPOR domain-containing protein [Asticcacaulis sp.]
MSRFAPFSRLAFLTVCLAATGLSGCDLPKGDGKDFQRMAARLAEIDIEGKGDTTSTPPADAASQSASSPASRDQQIELVFDTAKELTTGKGGLMEATQGPRQAAVSSLIRVVNPLDMERPQADTPLDTGLKGSAAKGSVQAELPVAPIAKAAPVPVVTPVQAAFSTIQVGSFSSADGARAAWASMQARHPGLDNFRPVMQPVTTADGRVLVRLRIGPVQSPAQAERLCGQLDIRDRWCLRLG